MSGSAVVRQKWTWCEGNWTLARKIGDHKRSLRLRKPQAKQPQLTDRGAFDKHGAWLSTSAASQFGRSFTFIHPMWRGWKKCAYRRGADIKTRHLMRLQVLTACRIYCLQTTYAMAVPWGSSVLDSYFCVVCRTKRFSIRKLSVMTENIENSCTIVSASWEIESNMLYYWNLYMRYSSWAGHRFTE